MANVCAACGAPLEENERFCTACGTPVERKKVESHRYCQQCGNLLPLDAIFCDVCGREVERPKHKEQKAEPEEPAEMEGLVSPTITDDMFAGAKELRNVKFDGFESAEDHAVKKPEEVEEELRPKAAASFEMDAAALPERKKEEKPKEPPKPVKKEVTAETIKNSNPYGQYGAKSGGKQIMTAKPQAQEPKPSQNKTAPQGAPEAPKKSGFAAFIEKILGIFKKK